MKLNLNQQRGLWWTISAALILAGVISMALSWNQYQAPLKPGLDFTGGTRLQLERDCSKPDNCKTPIQIAEVRQILDEQKLAESNVQVIGQNAQGVAIRTKDLNQEERTKLTEALTAKLGQLDVEKSQIDTVGPTLGKQLLASGLLALIVSFAAIIVYVSVRFQFDYALFAIVALFHDVLVTMGFFSILGLTRGVEVNSLFIVGLLTIIGFSVNDTVVIYDRVRENLKYGAKRSISETVDIAVNQTLGRSINTSLTTGLPLIGIYIFGGETLKDFALTLIVGFAAGAYSSIFIASTLLAWWRQRQERGGYNTVTDSSPEEI
ncbi:protein translocase subunit SecF [Acaryochloris marina]|uniref:protein translocase subunit SecF n=1 Tax=Acaryochloris marina TaxID=155978 RepID=UPI0021C3D04F|nr:protein translocase subunit SecF [Acaryochloris marina]BDM80608.1 protein-export membrane protein SecF [Acaryochloris marina MBIC10699]